MKKTLRRQTWRERIIATGSKDPMICPHCENYYEYMGEVCLENGQLVIKTAMSKGAKTYLERMISNLTGIQKPQEEEKTKEEKGNRPFTAIQKETSHQFSLFGMS